MSSPDQPVQLRIRSQEVTEGNRRAPPRGVPRAGGPTPEDFPGTLPRDRRATRAKVGVRDAGGVPFEFVTIAVSDGISMGHEGMRASLVSREVIADSVECVMHA